jgi:hypothetical protein
MTTTAKPAADPSSTDPVPPTPSRLDWRFGLALAGIFAVLLAPRIGVHIFWRDEWHTWLFAKDAPDLGTLFVRARYDGHPLTWYWIVWGLTRVFDDPVAMKAAHAVFATLVALVVGLAAPFPRWQRALLVFGYFFAFEYAVLSRNYSIGVLGLLFATAAFVRAPNRPFWPCVGVAFAIHANAMAALIAVPLGVYFGLTRWLRRPIAWRGLLVGGAIVIATSLLAAIETSSPPDRANSPWVAGVDVELAGRVSAATWRAFVPIPLIDRGWWNKNVLDFTVFTPVIRFTEPLLGLATLFGLALFPPGGRRDLRWLWLASAGIILAFEYFKIAASLRHHGFVWIAFVIVYWLARGTPTPGGNSVRTKDEWFWRTILAAQFVAALCASVADVLLPFSAARATAGFLRDRYPTAQVITQRDFEGGSIAGELGRDVYFPVPGRWGTYVIWNDQRGVRVSPGRLDQIAAELAAADPAKPVVLALGEVARFDDASMSSERFTVYEWLGTIPAATAPVPRQNSAR